MAFRLQWLVNGRVVLLHIYDHTGVEDMIAVNRGLEVLLQEAGEKSKVHIIAEATRLAKQLYRPSREAVKSLSVFSSPNMGRILVVGANSTISFAVWLLCSLAGRWITTHQTMQDALTSLAKDGSLPPISIENVNALLTPRPENETAIS